MAPNKKRGKSRKRNTSKVDMPHNKLKLLCWDVKEQVIKDAIKNASFDPGLLLVTEAFTKPDGDSFQVGSLIGHLESKWDPVPIPDTPFEMVATYESGKRAYVTVLGGATVCCMDWELEQVMAQVAYHFQACLMEDVMNECLKPLGAKAIVQK